MAISGVEKTEDELRKELDALLRQQREISDRIRDPRGLRRTAPGSRTFPPSRPFLRPADRTNSKDEPPPKRRLSSAVVKMKVEEDGEIIEDGNAGTEVQPEIQVSRKASRPLVSQHDLFASSFNGRQRLDNGPDLPETLVPRVMPKNEDEALVKRNRRMLGQLLGTLERFKKEDVKLSGSDAYMRRSISLQRAEEKAREESERLRQQERERIVENRKRDLVLRARVAAKAEEKKLELLFLRWSEHHKKLTSFIRTKTKPHIYYLPVKALEENVELSEQKKEQAFLEWKAARREELSSYQKEIEEQYIANAEKELERWATARKGRMTSNDANLQETMDKELETHRLEHGPKARKIPGSNNEEEEEVEDINVGEDDLMDDVLVLDENERVDEPIKREEGEVDPLLDAVE